MKFFSFYLIAFKISHFILAFDIYVDSNAYYYDNRTDGSNHTILTNDTRGSFNNSFSSLANALHVFDEIVEENEYFRNEYLYFQNFKNNDSVNFILKANSESKLTLSEMISMNTEYNKTQCVFPIFNHSFELPFNITFKGETSSSLNFPKITFEAENVVFYTNFSLSLNFKDLTIQENDNTQTSDCIIPTQKYGVFMINRKTLSESKKLWEWSHLLFLNCYINRFWSSSINISYSYFISAFEEDNYSTELSYQYTPNTYFMNCLIENFNLKGGDFFIYSINFLMNNVSFNVGKEVIFSCSEKNNFSNIILIDSYFKTVNIVFSSAYNCNISLLRVKFETLSYTITYFMNLNNSNILTIKDLSLFFVGIYYIFHFQYNNTVKITNISLNSVNNLKSIVYAESNNSVVITNMTALNVYQSIDRTIFNLNRLNTLDVKYFNFSNPEDSFFFNIFLISNNSNLININQVFIDSEVSKIMLLDGYSNELNVSNVNFTNFSKQIYSENLISNVDTNLLLSNNNSINLNNNSFYGFYLNSSGMLSSCGTDENSKLLCTFYCVPGLYSDLNNNFCHFCSNNCSLCEEERTFCTECPANFFLTEQKVCLSNCPHLFFENVLDRKCHSICPEGLYGDINNFSCVDSCSIGFYPNKNDHLCELCDFNCKECFDNQSNCTICKYDFLEKRNETCFDPKNTTTILKEIFPEYSLDTHYSEKWTIKNLLNESLNSSTCGFFNILGGSKIFTNETAIIGEFKYLPFHLTGRVTFFFIKIDFWESNTFYIKIDNKTTFNATFENTDDDEEFLCGTESIPEALRSIDTIFFHNSSKMKIELLTDLNSNLGSWGIFNFSLTLSNCGYGKYVDTDFVCKPCNFAECNTYCPDGYYFDDNINFPLLCYDSCKTCSGPHIYDCASCESSYYFYNNTCYIDCPDGTYKYSENMTCLLCNSTCKICTDLNKCILCLERFTLEDDFLCHPCTFETCPNNCKPEEFFYNFTCENECPIHYFSDSNHTCHSCYENCNSCNGTSENNCIDCKDSFYFYNSFCLSECPAKTYKNNETMKCSFCNSLCETCSDPYSCLTCPNGSYLESNSVCQLCTKEQCPIKCGENEFLFNYTCLNSCPSHYFSNENKECLKCDDSCESCDQASQKNCLSCFPPFYLFEGECLKDCPSKTYKNNNTYQCSQCHYSCENCIGPNNTDCVSCENRTRSLKFVSNFSGVCSCIPSYYDDKKSLSCYACHYTCKECFGSEFYMCTNCSETRGNLPHNTAIYNRCPCIGDLIDFHQPMCLDENRDYVIIFVQSSQKVAIYISFAALISLPFATLLGTFFKFIEVAQELIMILYINNNLPLNMKNMLVFLKTFEMSYLLPGIFNNPNENQVNSESFGQNKLSSLFIDNSFTLIIVSCILPWFFFFITCFLEKYPCRIEKLEKNEKYKMFLKYMNNFFKYNLIFLLFQNSTQEMSLFIALQLNYISFSNTIRAISSTLCIIILVMNFLMIYWTKKITNRVLINPYSPVPAEYSAIFQNLNLAKKAAAYYPMIKFLRKFILSFLIVFLYDRVQILFIGLAFLTIFMYFYIRMVQPYLSKIKNIIGELTEILQCFLYGLLFLYNRIKLESLDDIALYLGYITIFNLITIILLNFLALLAYYVSGIGFYIYNLTNISKIHYIMNFADSMFANIEKFKWEDFSLDKVYFHEKKRRLYKMVIANEEVIKKCDKAIQFGSDHTHVKSSKISSNEEKSKKFNKFYVDEKNRNEKNNSGDFALVDDSHFIFNKTNDNFLVDCDKSNRNLNVKDEKNNSVEKN